MEGELISDNHTRGDVRRIETALRRGWDIPQAVRDNLPRVMASVVAKGSNREKVAAARVLLLMAEQNNRAEPQQAHVSHYHLHESVPITADNIEERKRQLAARIARIR